MTPRMDHGTARNHIMNIAASVFETRIEYLSIIVEYNLSDEYEDFTDEVMNRVLRHIDNIHRMEDAVALIDEWEGCWS